MKAIVRNTKSDDLTFNMNNNERPFDSEIEITNTEFTMLKNLKFDIENLDEPEDPHKQLLADIILKEIDIFNNINDMTMNVDQSIAIYEEVNRKMRSSEEWSLNE